MKHIIVFGSLRAKSSKGYNFNRFGGQTHIRDLALNGYDMYSLGSYPAICEGEGAIKCELHSVTDEAFERIDRMEIGAGYTGKTLDTPEGPATIYLFPADRLASRVKVESGDWA